MSQEYKVEPYTIILFLFGVSFLIAAGSTAEAQEGAHEHQSLERKIQSLTERIDALEAAQQQPSAASAPPAASPPNPHPARMHNREHKNEIVLPAETYFVWQAVLARPYSEGQPIDQE